GQSTCDCGGTIRPGNILVGGQLHQEAFAKSEAETNKAEVFIVLGSSLTATPTNMFPLVAQEDGDKLVIVNRERTDYDHYADLVINDNSIKDLFIEVEAEMDK